MIHLLTIGTECCDGRIVNTNQQYIAQQLYEAGFFLDKSITVSDEPHILDDTIRESVLAAQVVITTGGLGPTEDDRTTKMVASACELMLVRNEKVVKQLKAYFEKTNRTMPEANEKQADFPKGAVILENPHGTAPGFYLYHDDVHIFCCPGVPGEMRTMIQDQVIPKLLKTCSSLREERHTTLFKCVGVGESHCAERIQHVYPLPEGMSISFQPRFPEIHIRLHALANCPEQEQVKHQLATHLHDITFTQDANESLAGAVIRLLKAQHKTVAIAESCTGGRIASELTAVPGASEVFLTGAITYSNEAKTTWLGVDEQVIEQAGAVSEDVAKLMASGLKEKSKADITLSVTGIAGPTGGTEEKPVGTVYFGVAEETGCEGVLKQCRGDREKVQRMATK